MMKKVNGIKEDYGKYAERGQNILKSFGEYSLTKDKIDQDLNMIMGSSYDFVKIANRIKRQTEQKEKIFSKLMDNMQLIQVLDNEINEVVDNIAALKRIEIDPDNYSPELAGQMRSVSENALDRLKWMEYELVKTYEYTTLTTFKFIMPSDTIMNIMYKSEKESGKSIKDIVSNLKLAMRVNCKKLNLIC